MGRIVRYGLFSLLGLIALVVLAGGVFLARFDPNALKPRIIAAVKQTTGRELTLNGPVGLRMSLRPTVEFRDAALANPPGFSRPQMASLEALDARIALIPLLRGEIVIRHLVLVRPDIHLELDKDGQANWQFSPPQSEAASSAASSAPGPGRTTPPITVTSVRIEDGNLVFRDGRTGETQTLALHRFTARATAPGAPLHLSGDATYNGVPLQLSGIVGPILRLQGRDTGIPWPVQLDLTAAQAQVSFDGTLIHPAQARGYRGSVHGTIPDLAAIAPLVAGRKLPPVHDLRFAADLADSGGPVPKISALTLHLGPTDLAAYVAGLKLASAEIDAPNLDQPIHITATAQRDAVPMSLTASIGAPSSALSAQPSEPLPITIDLQAADAGLTVQGTVQHPEILSGADVAINATIPNLAALSPLVRANLPAIKQMAFQARLADTRGGLTQGVVMHDVNLRTPNGDLRGDVSLGAGPPPVFTATLHADRVDADALIAAAKPLPAAPHERAAPSTSPSAPTPRPAASQRLFPDTPIRFDVLRRANSDLAVSIGDLRISGTDYRGITVHATLRDGRLNVAPFNAALPAGPMEGTLSVDASVPTPPVALSLRAPGLPLAPLLAAARMPSFATGNLEIYADLRGAGTSPHAIAAGLDGNLGLAMQGGTIDARLLTRLLGPDFEKADLVQGLVRGGSSQVQCFALRANAQHGMARAQPLVLRSSLLSLEGTGLVNLGEETLELQLAQHGRVGGTGVAVPLRVTGPIRSPKIVADASGALEANAGSLARLLGGVTGGKNPTTEGESCAGPLALARGQNLPQGETQHPLPEPKAPAKPPNPGALLRQLFH